MNGEENKVKIWKFTVSLDLKHFLIAFFAATIACIVYYGFVEYLIFGGKWGEDIEMFWDALDGPVSDIYSNFGFIYPPYWWYEFRFLSVSFDALWYFVLASKIIGFPVGIYFLNKKFGFTDRQRYVMFAILFPSLIGDIAVRNLNGFLFMVGAIILYYYDRKPFLAGLLFWIIGFKITTVAFMFPLLLSERKAFVCYGKEYISIGEFLLPGKYDKEGKYRKMNLGRKLKLLIANPRIRMAAGFILSVILMLIFFPISGFTLDYYWRKLTRDERYGETTVNPILTVARVIHFDHMVWLGTAVFVFLMLVYAGKHTEMLFPGCKRKVEGDIGELRKKFGFNAIFKKAVYITIAFQIILGVVGGIAHLIWRAGGYPTQ